MLKIYNDKINEKEQEISKVEQLNGKELFDLFSLEEKINNIRIRKIKDISDLSTDIN